MASSFTPKEKLIKTILFITSWYPNKSDATLGIFVRRHAQSAALLNNVIVLNVISSSTVKQPVKKWSNIDGVKELHIEYPKVKSKIPLLIHFLKLKRYKKYHNDGLEAITKEVGKVDIVHANIMNPVGLIAKMWLKKYKTPYVITEHWTGYLPADNRYKNSRLLNLTLPKIANKAAFVLPVSDDLKNALQQHRLGKNFRVIRNVVDIKKFSPLTNVKNRFLVVADLDNNQKNIVGLLSAFKTILNKHQSINLTIAGGGNDYELIKEAINNLQLSNNVELIGRIPAEELNKLLSTSYASILFSNFENLPCVIVEAFAAGIPFVGTNVGGIAEIMNSSRGFLVEPGDTEAFAIALSKCISTTWDVDKIRKYAVEHFSLEAIGKQLDAVYTEVLK